MTVINMDCLMGMSMLPDNSVDAVVTDPPYGLSAQSQADIAECLRNWMAGCVYEHGKSGFMGRKWDSFVPGPEVWREVLRVLKPGGHVVAFAGTRTQHLMALSLQLAGFEIRDMLAWIYGCLSEDSEILTEDGWMPYNNAKQKRILSYDVQDDIYQWEEPSRWYEYHVESDTAYRIQSDHTDQIVSRGHRCLVERSGKLTFVPADELAGVERVPYLQSDFSALPQGRGELLLETVLRQGEGLAQATFSERQGQEVPKQRLASGEEPGMERRINVLQAQGEVCRSVDKVRSVPGASAIYGSQGRVCDGTPADRCCGDRQGADASGVCAPHKPRRDGQQVDELDAVCDKCGSQTLRARASYRTTLATVSTVEYSGVLWCPTVSTGAFVARRNGRVFLTGNSGFPKSLDVSKAIDAAAGAEREVTRPRDESAPDWPGCTNFSSSSRERRDLPATEAARQWQGWGTALKPALEPITLARKPLIGTVATNVLTHGTGAINVDGCRVGGEDNLATRSQPRGCIGKTDAASAAELQVSDNGRFPANLLHDGSEELVALFPASSGAAAPVKGDEPSEASVGVVTGARARVSGKFHGDSGSAARFFFSSKGCYNEDIWQNLNLPRESASIADATMFQQRASVASALALAVSAALPEGLRCKSVCLGPSTSATASELKRLSIAVTQTIANIDSKFWLGPKPAELSLSRAVANVAVNLGPTGTATIRASRWKSDGSADLVTFDITPTSLGAGVKGYAQSTANRLYYCAKASKRDREEGLHGFTQRAVAGVGALRDGGRESAARANTHPTVKPTDLMRYLCRLITPPGGLVLDPFSGSGSTGKAAVLEGFQFVGFELDPDYTNIANARIEAATATRKERTA